MTQPSLLISATGEKLDPHVGPDGATRLKLAIGDVTLGGGITPHAAWDGVATHVDGAAFNAGADGVGVPASVDESGNAVAVGVTAGLPVTSTRGVVSDVSGSIATNATSQELAPINAARRYLMIQNTDPAEDMWIDFTQDAVIGSPSFLLPAGAAFGMEASFVSSEKITVIAATAGHTYSAREA